MDSRSRSAAFIASLIQDVIAARQRLSASHTHTARRDVVRASLAAIEGMTWIAREHVRIALADIGQLTPIADLALRELSYSVTESGRLVEQTRGLPLLTSVRLVVSQAQIISPDLWVEFSRAGWSDLGRALKIRNRITHPKPAQDFAISDDDLAAVGSAVSWLTATVEYVMASTNLALVQYNDQLRVLAQRLIDGDADALAEYQAALLHVQDD